MRNYLSGDNWELFVGDCRNSMSMCVADNSVDSIVCDPPYELGFMGKSWDNSGIANDVAMWKEVLRVLKPGGHLLAFSGSRTYHRMVCAIEDAGFEIRDQIMWIYSSGFPKSHNMDSHRGKLICGCDTGTLPYTHENTKSQTERDLRDLLDTDVPPSVDSCERGGQVLQPSVPQQSSPTAKREQLRPAKDRCEQPRVEGGCDDVQAEGKLQGDSLCAGAGSVSADGAGGRLRDGTPFSDGKVVRLPTDANGSGSPYRSRPDEQSAQQSGIMADEQLAQTVGAWPLCGGCGLPMVPRGWGTALKPAHEPIVMARKPLIRTVAANVGEHGTGAINIDGCRVGEFVNTTPSGVDRMNAKLAEQGYRPSSYPMGDTTPKGAIGRWPANLIHDGSDEVLASFPDAKGQQGDLINHSAVRQSPNGIYSAMPSARYAIARVELDKSAARFFYCAKASKADRHAGMTNTTSISHGSTLREIENAALDGNNHPTVKPNTLMRYLCRLITPPGGTVFDPFTGSGSTGRAALQEGFKFIGCELSDEYAAIAAARIGNAL